MFDPYFSAGIVLFWTVVYVAVAVLAIWKGFGPVEGWVARWASAHGVELTEENRSMVTERLQRGRRIRTIGFLLGWSVPYITMWVLRDVSVFATNDLAGWSQSAFVPGYLIAAIAAEVTVGRGEQRSGVALLEPRRLRAYLPHWARVGPLVMAAVALVTVAIYAVVPWRYAPNGFGPSVAGQFGTALWVVGLVAAIEVIQRWVIRRRQAYSTAAMVEADDAMRSSSVSILAGVSIAMSVNGWGMLMWNLGTRTDLQVLRWIGPAVSLGMVFVGLLAFARLSDPLLQWRVRRGTAMRQPA